MKFCIDCHAGYESYQHNQTRCYTCLEKKYGHLKRFKGRPKKECVHCNLEFRPRTQRQVYCSPYCANEGWHAAYFKRQYGLSLEDYNKLYELNSGKCHICDGFGFKMNDKVKNSLCVDHCHKTGIVRGLLCHNCNRALGLLQDSKLLLKKSIEYLEGSETIRKE